jgi:hypothetical protein
MLTIITPCYRQENIPKLFDSIRFEQIDKWIIVYDTTNNRKYDKLYDDNPKIIECFFEGGISGNPQRNYALSLVEDGFIYFLDDDNIIHPNFWSIVKTLDPHFFYTFDQIGNEYSYFHYGCDTLYGNRIALLYIDTAMYIIHKKFIKDIKWREDLYNADGYFICDIFNNNIGAHKYINKIGCYYNYLRK